MHYTGKTMRVEDSDSVPYDVPTFLYGEPASEHLLYARAVWGLAELTDVPPEVPPLAATDPPPTQSERERLARLWTAAWETLWTMYTFSYDAIRDDYIPITGIPQPKPIDWLSAASPAILSGAGFAAWRTSIPKLEPLGSHYSHVAMTAQASFQRGLACVAVLPVSGVWWASVRGRLLLISPFVHESPELLNSALDEFRGESTPK